MGLEKPQRDGQFGLTSWSVYVKQHRLAALGINLHLEPPAFDTSANCGRYCQQSGENWPVDAAYGVAIPAAMFAHSLATCVPASPIASITVIEIRLASSAYSIRSWPSSRDASETNCRPNGSMASSRQVPGKTTAHSGTTKSRRKAD